MGGFGWVVENLIALRREKEPTERWRGMEISFDEFQRLDLRIGKITEVFQIPGSRNLMKIVADFGTEQRQAVAGLLRWYTPEELVGKKCVFLLNLQKRVLMGVESQCMILAAQDEQGN